ncbi:MAG: DNA polymerase [Anaerolineae bacterium]|nr:DNA polymerase [Anaerolineae bacterium]
MSTALELGRTGWRSYLETAKALPDLPRIAPVDELVRDDLVRRAREFASMLKERFDVDRVILFGSLVHSAWFTPDSDVDLAVEGLSGSDYWLAWRLMEDAFPGRSVDLVDLAEVSDSLRVTIETHGERL